MIREREVGAVVERGLGRTRSEDMIRPPGSERERRTPGRNRMWPRGPAPALEEEETKTEEGRDLGLAVIDGEAEEAGAEKKVGGGKGRDLVMRGSQVKLIQRSPRHSQGQLRKKTSC